MALIAKSKRRVQHNPSLPVVLWVSPVSDMGGVARHFLDVARTGIPGWHVVFLCPDGALREALTDMGADVLQLEFGTKAGLIKSRRTLAMAARFTKATLVHTHLAFADIVSALTALPRGTKRATAEHGIAGGDAFYHGSKAQGRFMAAVREFEIVIAVSNATRAAMQSKWGAEMPITVIYNGVDIPIETKTKSPKKSGVRILSLARLEPEKRIEKLIEAFGLVLESNPDAHLLIAGEGSLRDELEGLARFYNVSHRVTFSGFVDSESAMKEADVLVQLSLWENCSYSILDAQVRGLPVIASAVGGNPEIVRFGKLVSDLDASQIAKEIVTPTDYAPEFTWPTPDVMCSEIAATYSEIF